MLNGALPPPSKLNSQLKVAMNGVSQDEIPRRPSEVQHPEVNPLSFRCLSQQSQVHILEDLQDGNNTPAGWSRFLCVRLGAVALKWCR